MSAEIQIADRLVGPEHPPLVIAEIGINHEGSLTTAKQMVDAAAAAGVEVVKHQTHIVEDEMSAAARETIPGNADVSIYDIMDRCSLSAEDEAQLQAYVHARGMIFLSTPFSRAAVDRLVAMNVPAFKVGSGECNNYPLLEYIAGFNRPVILSTGMNDLASVRKAVDIFDRHCVPVALLHTTNLYPTPVHLVRLGAFEQLKAAFPDKVVGLSDHTTANYACYAATALGASILERHFTDSMHRPGPDIVNSMDPASAAELIRASRDIWQMRGGEKQAAKEEAVTIDFAFASVVSVADIPAGDLLTEENLWVKRPGTGEIRAEDYRSLIGRRAARSIAKDQQLSWQDVAQ